MSRSLISSLSSAVGSVVTIQGRVFTTRVLGDKISFLLVHDRSGNIQVVFDRVLDVKAGDAVEITGSIVAEPRSKSGIEMHGQDLRVLSTSVEEYPIDLTKPELNLQLATLLDHRTLSLRHPKTVAIFKLYDLLLESYEQVMRREGFTEVKTPKLLQAASEGGANFFKVSYFDTHAFLAQSPQLYKQILVGVFERVFEIGPVFRAEPHFTTRHVNEYISLDAEMGFITDYRDVMHQLNVVLKGIFGYLGEHGAQYLAQYDATVPIVPDEIPAIKLSDMRTIVKAEYGYDIPADTDIDPEGERLAGRYAKETFNSDFIFLTHYPWSHRPFYTMPNPDIAEETFGFDLIYRGVELVTGSQRIHTYAQLIENMEKKGVKPAGLEFYLDTFKYAMPPHGGWAIGSERLIQHLLGLGSIKEAVLFPRDVKRLSP